MLMTYTERADIFGDMDLGRGLTSVWAETYEEVERETVLFDEGCEDESLELELPGLADAMSTYWDAWAKYERDDAGAFDARARRMLVTEQAAQLGIRL